MVARSGSSGSSGGRWAKTLRPRETPPLCAAETGLVALEQSSRSASPIFSMAVAIWAQDGRSRHQSSSSHFQCPEK